MPTGEMTIQRRNGVWVEVPIVRRNGRLCACGDAHGVFPNCVGSAWDNPAPRPKRRNRKPVDNPAARSVQEFFPLNNRRLPRAVPQDIIDACDECGPVHKAFYYCSAHRRQAVRNVLIARRKSAGISSLHMMMAEKGFDIAS